MPAGFDIPSHDPIEVTLFGDKDRWFILPDGRRVCERCAYCQRIRGSLTESCGGCGSPP